MIDSEPNDSVNLPLQNRRGRRAKVLTLLVLIAAGSLLFYVRMARGRTPQLSSVLKLDLNSFRGAVWLSETKIFLVAADSRKSPYAPVFDVTTGTWSAIDLAGDENMLHRAVNTYASQRENTVLDLDIGVPGPANTTRETSIFRLPPEVETVAAKSTTRKGDLIADVRKCTRAHASFNNAIALLTGSDPQRRSDSEVWITDKNGVNNQVVGVLVYGVNSNVALPVSSLQWSPDEKRLLLVYGDRIYIVPIDAAVRRHVSEIR